MKHAFLSIILTNASIAHPVAFEGAYQFMLGSSGDIQNLEMYYSYSSKAAWGLHAMQFDQEESFIGVQHNWLLKRWNLAHAQGNLYSGIGAGVANAEDPNTSAAGIAFLRADYETRRFYSALDAKWVEANDFSQSIVSAAVGIAPYKAEFDELNTWMIFQVEHAAQMQDEFEFIPKLRFFKDAYFLELGSSLSGKPVVNFMIHF